MHVRKEDPISENSADTKKGKTHDYILDPYQQLALAHTYGTGMEASCENVKKTLMKFLHGLTVDCYVAMRMDAIPLMKDAVGGVPVTVKDDFSMVNPSITLGELPLRGDQVIDYVRTRKDVGDQKNVPRMERQWEYVDSFLHALNRKAQEDSQFLFTIVSDCSVSKFSAMLGQYKDYTVAGAITPEGENIIADGYYEFYADEAKLDALILQLFYARKK